MCICTIQGTQTYYFLSTDAYPLTLWGAVWSSSTQRYQVKKLIWFLSGPQEFAMDLQPPHGGKIASKAF